MMCMVFYRLTIDQAYKYVMERVLLLCMSVYIMLTTTNCILTQNIGPAGISQGPLPAHVAHSAHINQSQHVILMPQHPPAVINQAPPTNHHQHGMVAAPHFQQHMHMGGHSYAGEALSHASVLNNMAYLSSFFTVTCQHHSVIRW